jgi:hypothetical protein
MKNKEVTASTIFHNIPCTKFRIFEIALVTKISAVIHGN